MPLCQDLLRELVSLLDDSETFYSFALASYDTRQVCTGDKDAKKRFTTYSKQVKPILLMEYKLPNGYVLLMLLESNTLQKAIWANCFSLHLLCLWR